jgi:hypothetical protein
MNGVMAELMRITAYEGRLSRELARLKAELAKLQTQRRELAAAERAREAAAARRAEQAAEETAAREAVERRAAALAEGRVAAPEPPPSAGAPLAEIHGWVKREQARLDAQLRVFRDARQNPARPTA